MKKKLLSIILLFVLLSNSFIPIVFANETNNKSLGDLLEIIPDEINLEINETEFEQAEVIVKNKISLITKIDESNISCEIQGYRYWLTTDKLNIRNIKIKISKDGQEKSKNIKVIYANSLNWNEEDLNYVEGVIERTNFNRTWGFELDHSIDKNSFTSDSNFSWDKVIGDETIKTVYYSEGSGGFLNYYESGNVCIFKNGVFYKSVTGEKADIPKVTIPDEMENVDGAYENYAKNKLENYLKADNTSTTVKINQENKIEYTYTVNEWKVSDKIIIAKKDEMQNYFTEKLDNETNENTNITEVDETYIQNLLDMVPDKMNINIPEVEYERSSIEIRKNIEEILSNNQINYNISEYGNIELENIAYNGRKITIYASGYEIYLKNIRKAYISIDYIKSKEIDLVYNNSNNRNFEDEQYVKNLYLTSPKYYEVGLDFIEYDVETEWKEFYNIVSKYYNNQINNNSIVAKADCGAGETGLNVVSGDGNVGTYLALFKNGILYDIRTMGNERSVPVINVPSTIKEEDINDYVIYELNKYKPNISISSISKGTKDIETLGIDITDGYTINYEENGYATKAAIIIRKENIHYQNNDCSCIFDGENHGIELSLYTDGVSIKYMDSNGEFTLEQMPKYSNIGVYTITYMLSKDNYNTIIDSNIISIYGIKDVDSTLKLKNNIVIVKDYVFSTQKIYEKFDIFALKSDFIHLDKNKNAVSSDLIKTGDYIKILINDKELEDYAISILGDVNGDGKISTLDYVKIKNHIMKTKLINGDIYLGAADVNEDEKISALDYVRIKNHIMNGGNKK